MGSIGRIKGQSETRTDQVAQGNVVVGHDTFDLVKLCQVGSVGRLVSALISLLLAFAVPVTLCRGICSILPVTALNDDK